MLQVFTAWKAVESPPCAHLTLWQLPLEPSSKKNVGLALLGAGAKLLRYLHCGQEGTGPKKGRGRPSGQGERMENEHNLCLQETRPPAPALLATTAQEGMRPAQECPRPALSTPKVGS